MQIHFLLNNSINRFYFLHFLLQSRKALASMVPGVIFDPNGILLDVGSGLLRGKGVAGSGGSSRSQPTSLEELAPHLASQLAIGGNLRTRAASPDPSEDSSISTAVSMTKMTIGAACNDDEGVISGGPIPPKPGLRQHQSSGTLSSLNAAGSAGRSFFSPNIYPCASTTSGVSSASEVDEDEDENAYYASRGASVCSTLLHAMWQIDDRIREPPSYTFELGTFDLCPSPVSISLHGKTVGASNECSSDGGGTTSSKGKEFKVASSKRKAIEATAHRLPFQCTSSLTLYFSKHQVGDKDLSTALQFWESPLEYLQTNDRALSSHGNDSFSPEPRRKRKDSQSGDTLSTSASQSPNRRQQIQIGEYVDDVPNSMHSEHEKEEYVTYKLESVGTGSTKREAKHKASAKMLGMLFPECCNLVEVKAAAEAARECYAAQKQQHQSLVNQTKRAKLTESEKGYGGVKEYSPKNPKDREFEILGSDKSNHLSRFLSADGEAFLPRNEINNIKSVAGLSRGPSPGTSNGSGEEESFSEGVVSVASLSLSEPLEDTAQVKWGDLMNAGELSCNTEQHNFEIDVDAALQSLQDVDEEGRSASTDLSIEGKFILRRANSDDSDCVHTLLSKNEAKSTLQNSAKKQRFSGSNGFSILGPMGLLSMLPRNAIILLLSRAVAPHEEPPLGCAVLTLSTARRVLNICDIAHEKILPKERFMDCLTVFAEKMKCTLDNVGAHRHNRSLTVSSNKMMSIVRHYVSSTEKDSPFCDDNHNAENVIDSDHHETGVDTGDISPTSPYRAENDFSNHAQGNSPHNYLQSVKEEDSAEEDDRSEDEDILEKSNVESSASAGRRRCKPGKRTRVS